MRKPIVAAMLLSLSFAYSNLASAVDLNKHFDNTRKALISKTQKLKPEILRLALAAYKKAHIAGITTKPVLTIIDYSLPSTEKRLWVLDLEKQQVLFHTLVAHGQGSGDKYATKFSDNHGSLQSSIGVFRTATTYIGHHGYTLRIKGLEQGFNTNAEDRLIVIHGAWYVNETLAKKQGRIGRSWGCPAVANELATPIIDTIKPDKKGSSLVFAYYPEKQWLKTSKYIQA